MSLITSEVDPCDDKIRRLATLILNGVNVSSGDWFPAGWRADTRERIYIRATESMLLAAVHWNRQHDQQTIKASCIAKDQTKAASV